MSLRQRVSQPVHIGLDIGYGFVKVVTDWTALLFPAICGHAFKLTFQAEEIARRYPGEQLTDEQGRWFIGNLANSQLLPHAIIRLVGRSADETILGDGFRLRMAKAAFAKLFPDVQPGDVVHVHIATGLPVEHMSDTPAMKAMLLGKHHIVSDLADFIVNVVDVSVMPQPYGTIYASMISQTGDLNPSYASTRLVVCDLGTLTINLATDFDGEFIASQSGSVESGMHTVIDRIQMALQAKYRETIPVSTIEQVLRTRTFLAGGTAVDCTDLVTEALEPLISATLALLGEHLKTGVTADEIYLSGGGASLVYDAVKVAYDQTRLVKDPQMANARGYLHYALFKSRDESR